MLGWWNAVSYLNLDPMDNTIPTIDSKALLELKGDLSHSLRCCDGELSERW